MRSAEFALLIGKLKKLRDSMRDVRETRKKYPGGVRSLLTEEQFKEMKTVEDELSELEESK